MIVRCLESYLHNYKYDMILKKNLTNLVEKNLLRSYCNDADIHYLTQFKVMLDTAIFNLGDIVALKNKYKLHKLSNSNIAETFLNNAEYFIENFEMQSQYVDNIKKKETEAASVKLNKLGVQCFKNNNFLAAAKYFHESTNNIVQIRDASHVDVLKAFFNTGRSYQKAGKDELACFYFERAEKLGSQYHKKLSLTEKASAGLNECRSMLNASATPVASLVSNHVL